MTTTATRASTAYAELSRTIQASGLLRRRYGYYWTQIIAMVSAFALLWVAFALLGESWWQLVVAAGLAVVVTQFGFLGHDAAHRQIFASHRWNEWSARVMAGLFAGLSYGWWASKHNRHHRGPNQLAVDPDIAKGAFVFTPNDAQRPNRVLQWLTARQGYLFFPLLLLEGVNLHISSLLDVAQRPEMKHRTVEAVFIVLRLTAFVVVLFVVLSPGKAAAFLGVQLGVFGVLLGGSFAPNHKGMPVVPADARVDFLRRQVLMSRNVDGNPFTDFAMGGLNYQIEHHLFPSMPRPNLKRAQPIVRAFCAEHGVTYTQTGLFASYRIVLRYLNRVGLLAPEPYNCPVASQFRA